MPVPREVVKAITTVSSILYSSVTLNFDVLTPKCEAFTSVP